MRGEEDNIRSHRPHRSAATLAVGAALLLVAAPRAAGVRALEALPVATASDSLDALLSAARGDLETYWRTRAHRWPAEPGNRECIALGTCSPQYEGPTSVLLYDSVLPTPCGPARRGNAFYCGRNGGIYLDRRFLEAEFREGDFAPVLILAHEWGHLVQHRLGWRDRYPIRHELQADCYAGGFARHADSVGVLEAGDFDEGLRALFRAGSTDLIWFDPAAHGSSGERIDAFTWGFRNGSRACRGNVFLRKAGGSVPRFDVAAVPEGSLADMVPPALGRFRLVDVEEGWPSYPLATGAVQGMTARYRRADGAVADYVAIRFRTPAAARRHHAAAVLGRFAPPRMTYRKDAGKVFGPSGAEVGSWAKLSLRARGCLLPAVWCPLPDPPHELILWLNGTVHQAMSSRSSPEALAEFAAAAMP